MKQVQYNIQSINDQLDQTLTELIFYSGQL